MNKIFNSVNHNNAQILKIKELKKMLDRISLILLIVGGLNWGSVGLFRFDIVSWLFGGQADLVSRIIYTLVGLSALWCVSLLFRRREDIFEEN